jgi:hypothetical protein
MVQAIIQHKIINHLIFFKMYITRNTKHSIPKYVNTSASEYFQGRLLLCPGDLITFFMSAVLNGVEYFSIDTEKATTGHPEISSILTFMEPERSLT